MNIKSLNIDRAILREISLIELRPAPHQPRKHFDEEKLKVLSETIKRVGVLEPIVVREVKENEYQIIAGERRWRAAQLAGLETVPCMVKRYTDKQSAQIALIENMCREGLNAIEEARAIQRLINEFSYTHEHAAEILGIDRTAVTNLLRLLKLDQRIQQWISESKLSGSHGRTLAGTSLERQYFYAKKCMEEGWSSRTLENEIKSSMLKVGSKGVKYKIQDTNNAYLAKKLSDQLNCEVSVKTNKNKSYALSFNFKNLDQMQSLLDKLGYKE